MPKIHLTTTDGTLVEFELTAERTTVGRAEGNDFVVPDGSVSSRHAEIILKDDGGIELMDLGSTNGTHVNGERIERADIAPGGTFRLGSCESFLEGPAPASASASEETQAESEYAEDEEAAPASTGGGAGWSSAPAQAAVITGLGATPCPTQRRQGFGPKVKKKDSSGSTLMLLAVAALVACAAACFMILKMGA